MGDQRTLPISESEVHAAKVYRDTNAPAWNPWVQKGYITAPKIQEIKEKDEDRGDRRARVGLARRAQGAGGPRDPDHQPHLQNFFDAVRGKAKLNCPPEVGYESAVADPRSTRRFQA